MVAGDAAGRAGHDRDRARTDGGVIRVGQLNLDVGRLTADTGQGPVPLTRLEFLLLRELVDHAGQPVSKSRLLATVWGYQFDPGSNVVDVCVRRLRSKFGFDLIKTVRGEGYQLAAQLPRVVAAVPSALISQSPDETDRVIIRPRPCLGIRARGAQDVLEFSARPLVELQQPGPTGRAFRHEPPCLGTRQAIAHDGGPPPLHPREMPQQVIGRPLRARRHRSLRRSGCDGLSEASRLTAQVSDIIQPGIHRGNRTPGTSSAQSRSAFSACYWPALNSLNPLRFSTAEPGVRV